MKKSFSLLLLVLLVAVSFSQTQVDFAATNNSWSVPAGVTSITFEAWGGGGGGSSCSGGGGGSYARRTFNVTSGTVCQIVVGVA
jgi:hypothetical protein